MKQIDLRETEPLTLPPEWDWIDSPRELAELRETRPLTRFQFPDGNIGWFVTNHELALKVLGDQRFTRLGAQILPPGGIAITTANMLTQDPECPEPVRALVDRYRKDGQIGAAFRDPEVRQALREHQGNIPFFTRDPVDHNRIRRTFVGNFTVRQASGYRALIERIVSERLDAVGRSGSPVDLVETYTEVVPSLVICAVLGIPEEWRWRFEKYANIRKNFMATIEAIEETHTAFFSLAQDLVDLKRKQPADDVLTAVVKKN